HNGFSNGQRRSARGVVPRRWHPGAIGVCPRSDSDDHFHPKFAFFIDGAKEEARAIGKEVGYDTIARDDSWLVQFSYSSRVETSVIL
ncbi:hypothetical protein TIFTF001_053031, partial [Ficus carica]